MNRFHCVNGLLVGLAVLGSAAPLSAQQFTAPNRFQNNGAPARAPQFNTPLPLIRQQQQQQGLIPNPNGGAPLLNNGTNIINANNGANLANLAAQNANQFNNNPFNNPYANNAYGYNGYNTGYGNPYLNPMMMNADPSWFWGTGMPTGGYTPFYPNYISPNYALNMQALTNPYLNSLSNPAMSGPFPAGVQNSTWALGAMGIGNILQQYPQLSTMPFNGTSQQIPQQQQQFP